MMKIGEAMKTANDQAAPESNPTPENPTPENPTPENPENTQA